MQKITFIKEDGFFKYIGKIEWREDTFQEVKDSLIEIEISEEDFEKIEKFKCKASLLNGKIQIEESNEFKNRYVLFRSDAYPDYIDFIDAQVKKSSSDPAMKTAGEEQEAKYFADCLSVKQMFPKPSIG